jgi:ketopantoate hydroxymethyltransferase
MDEPDSCVFFVNRTCSVFLVADLKEASIDAVARYRDEVREGRFPGEEHAFA